LGVSETAPTDTTVEPAPPIDPTLLEEHEENQPKFFDASSLEYDELELPEELKQKVSLKMEEVEEVLHEEL
jgi:heat shock protein beta